MGLLVGVGLMIGTLVGVGHQQPPVVLHATASHGGQTFAMATGPVDTDVEGLFMLDYLTGELQCRVIYPHRGGQFGGLYKHNVIADLGVQAGKKPDYVMVTGQASFTRGGATNTPAGCVVYVADANTGHFAAYSFMFNRTAYRAGAPQQGTFTLLGAGKAREVVIRE
jgi:hypothetical protein